MRQDSLINTIDSLKFPTNNIHSPVLKMIETSSEIVKNEVETANNILGMDYEFARIFIPVIVTLFVFFFGQFVSWWKSKKERKNELKSIKVTIEYWISLIETTINNQIKGCNNFYKDLQKSNNIQTESLLIYPLLVDKLQQLKLKELIETVMLNLCDSEKNKAKIIFNLVSQVEFLVKSEIQIRENYEKFESYTLKLIDEWNENIQRFYVEINETSMRINELEPNSQFSNNINQIYTKFNENKESISTNDIVNQLILPIEQNVFTYLNHSVNKECVLKLANSIQLIRVTKLKWDKHKEGHISMNKIFAKDIEDAYNKLKDVADKLKARKFKCILGIK